MKLKQSGQEMELILLLHGQEKAISEKELISILEKHFPEENLEDTIEKKVTSKPTEGYWFRINPLNIDQRIFQEKRKDAKQEKTRKLILEAFEELRKNPQRYGKSFKTIMPEKNWKFMTVEQIKEKASKIGDHMADWVEQALEWAQRISNGESWKSICNKADSTNYQRLIIFKEGYVHIVGGSITQRFYEPASFISEVYFGSQYVFYNTIPLVVEYEK